jgi:hypothetical protein
LKLSLKLFFLPLLILTILQVLILRHVDPPMTARMAFCWAKMKLGMEDGRLPEYRWRPLKKISPNLIRAVLAELAERGFADEDIITTMERHMKCGVGICRHCHMDDKLVCRDGPVFTLQELKQLKVMELLG